jgi:hypothetical protein
MNEIMWLTPIDEVGTIPHLRAAGTTRAVADVASGVSLRRADIRHAVRYRRD